MTDKEINEVVKDALTAGDGFMLNGKRIDPKEIYKSEDELLNEAAAKKMGWHPYSVMPENRHRWSDPKDGIGHDSVPDYCHSIEAAWEIVEWCRNRFVRSDLVYYRETNKFWFTLWQTQKDDDPVQAEADTAPMAIVKAFLKLP